MYSCPGRIERNAGDSGYHLLPLKLLPLQHQHKSDFATLNDEINVINNYMKIQQYRFRNRFLLNVNLPDSWDSILDAVLPKLTLQPIVENSIVHAFTEIAGQGIITIEAVSTKSISTYAYPTMAKAWIHPPCRSSTSH